jgi:hypothetical protein
MKLQMVEKDSAGNRQSTSGIETKREGPVAGKRGKDKISPEVQEWLERVLLPNLKKRLFDE